MVVCPKQAILFDQQCGQPNWCTNFDTHFECSYSNLFIYKWFYFSKLFTISSEFLFLNLCMMFLSTFLNLFVINFFLVFDFFDHCVNNQSGVFKFYLTFFGWTISRQTTVLHRTCGKFPYHCISNHLKLILWVCVITCSRSFKLLDMSETVRIICVKLCW